MMDRVPRNWLIAAALAAAVAFPACGGETAAIALTPATEAQELLAEPPAGLTVLDVRTPEEFAEGHLAGAANIDFYGADFADQLDSLDKNQPYFVYCRSGNRSAQTMVIMRDLGFTEVYELQGGILSWFGAGLPIE